MSETILLYVFLCASAFAAGAINSIAGGGTLLTFPALLRVLDPVGANATSTVALLPGSLAGSFGYRKELAACRRLVIILLLPSAIGGTVGALLVTRFPPSVFAKLVPWLILSASLIFLLQGPIRRMFGRKPHGHANSLTIVVVIIAQFFVAVYGGYFGAGIGILMLSVLPFMGTETIHETNAAKTILAAVINGLTVLVFVIEGKVIWSYALAMAAAAILGGYVGARSARRLPALYIRLLVVVIGFTLAGYYLWKEFA